MFGFAPRLIHTIATGTSVEFLLISFSPDSISSPSISGLLYLVAYISGLLQLVASTISGLLQLEASFISDLPLPLGDMLQLAATSVSETL